MAGDWIKMRTSLLTHPKVVRMSSAFGADRIKTVGGIYAVWCLFDMHSEDGQLEGYTAEALDGLVGLTGISAAMASVGWLEITERGIKTPEFDTHNGQSAKRRATDSERKRNDRKTSATDADKNRTDCGPEKRREEKKREEIVNKEIQAPEGVSDQVWQDFKKSRKTMRAAITQSAIDGIKREADKAGWSLEDALRECCARGWRGFKAEWVADKETPAKQQKTFAERDREAGMARWEEMTGRVHPDRQKTHQGHVIDVTPPFLELGQ